MINLIVYVEGKYDKMFVEGVLFDLIIPNKADDLIIIPYARKNNKLINKDIKSKFKHDYIFLSDLDSKQYPCITSRKDNRMLEYDALDSSKLFIVREEIESWFLAGIDTSYTQFKDFIIPKTTDFISKEEFDEILKNHYILDKSEFLREVCKNYDVNLARKRNKSFNYFLNKVLNYSILRF